MGVLHLLAKGTHGSRAWESSAQLREGLDSVEAIANSSDISEDDNARITSIVELLLEYNKERDEDEKENILRTLEELIKNEPIELSDETLEDWEAKVDAK